MLLQKALGADWDKLPPVIQRHYRTSSNRATCVKGNMEIGYPSYLLPLISLIHLCGGLVLKRGNRIETIVEKTSCEKNNTLFWSRTLKYPDNKKNYFFSKMIYLQDHELIEYVRFGLGLRLKVSVENSQLVYRSNGHIWQCGKLRLTFPDWLVLGNATIIENPITNQQFKLDFSISHPLLGLTYWYRGIFQYR
jgi:hypothetical protein